MFNPLIFLFGCFLHSSNNHDQCLSFNESIIAISALNDTVPRKMMPGGDQDEHGCKASAGFTWSVVRNRCVRIWETGMKMFSPEDKTKVTYAIFSADTSRVELFLPGKKTQIVTKTSRAGEPGCWENGSLKFSGMDRSFKLEDEGKLIFKTM